MCFQRTGVMKLRTNSKQLVKYVSCLRMYSMRNASYCPLHFHLFSRQLGRCLITLQAGKHLCKQNFMQNCCGTGEVKKKKRIMILRPSDKHLGLLSKITL